MASREVEGISLGVGAAVAFGTLAIFVKFAYRAGADPLPLLAFRFAVASVLLVAVTALMRRPIRERLSRVVALMCLGGLGYAFESALFFAALDRAPAGVVALVFYSYPLWTAMIALLIRIEPFRIGLILALIVGLAGIATIFSIPTTGGAGELLALASAVLVGVYLVGAQVFTRGVDAMTSAAWTAVGAAITLSATVLFAGGSLPAASLPHGAALAVATTLAFVGLYAAVSRIGSSRSAIAMMLEPVTTVFLAAALLGEPLSARVIIGMVLIVSSLPIVARTRSDEETVAVDTV